MQQKTWSYDLCLHRYRVLAQTYFFVIQAIFCSFGPPLIPKIKKCNKYLEILSPDHMIPWYHVWFLRYQVQQTELFCHLGQVFVLLPPPSPPPPLTAQKMKISKIKKNPGDIIILHKCTKNHDHPLYCSRDVVRDEFNSYFHLGLYFSLLPL